MVPNYHLQNRIGTVLIAVVAAIIVFGLYQYNPTFGWLWRSSSPPSR